MNNKLREEANSSGHENTTLKGRKAGLEAEVLDNGNKLLAALRGIEPELAKLLQFEAKLMTARFEARGTGE